MHHLDVVVFSSTLIRCSMISTNATVGVALLWTGTSIISHALIASATVAFQPIVALLLGSASCAVSTTFLWHCCVISTAVLHKGQQGQSNSCHDQGCSGHVCYKFFDLEMIPADSCLKNWCNLSCGLAILYQVIIASNVELKSRLFLSFLEI